VTVASRNRSIIRKGLTLLVGIVLVAALDVWPLLDLGLDASSPAHVEIPGGSPGFHHTAHDHGICGAMGSVHVVPVGRSRLATAAVANRVFMPCTPPGLPSGVAFSAHHSRAPPST